MRHTTNYTLIFSLGILVGIRFNAKKPISIGWQQQTVSLSIEQLNNINTAIHLFPNLFAIDIDERGNISGNQNFLNLFKKHNLSTSILDQTFKQRTPSGGFHYVFYQPNQCVFLNHKTTNSYLKIDIVTHGGYILTEPSQLEVCSENCGIKKCTHKKELRSYEIINPVKPIVFPESHLPIIKDIYTLRNDPSEKSKTKTYTLQTTPFGSRSEPEFHKTNHNIQLALKQRGDALEHVLNVEPKPGSHYEERGEYHTTRYDKTKAILSAPLTLNPVILNLESGIEYMTLRSRYAYTAPLTEYVDDIYKAYTRNRSADTLKVVYLLKYHIYKLIDDNARADFAIKVKIVLAVVISKKLSSSRFIAIEANMDDRVVRSALALLRQLGILVKPRRKEAYRFNKAYINKYLPEITDITEDVALDLYDYVIYTKYTDKIDAKRLMKEDLDYKKIVYKHALRKITDHDNIINNADEQNTCAKVKSYYAFIRNTYHQKDYVWGRSKQPANAFSLENSLSVNTKDPKIDKSILELDDINKKINNINPGYNQAYQDYQNLLNKIYIAAKDSEKKDFISKSTIQKTFELQLGLTRIYLAKDLNSRGVKGLITKWINKCNQIDNSVYLPSKKRQITFPNIYVYNTYISITINWFDICKYIYTKKVNNIKFNYTFNSIYKFNFNYLIININYLTCARVKKINKISPSLAKKLSEPTPLEKRKEQNIALEAIRNIKNEALEADKNKPKVLLNNYSKKPLSKYLERLQIIIDNKAQDCKNVREQMKKLPELCKSGQLSRSKALEQLQELDEWLRDAEKELNSLKLKYEDRELKESLGENEYKKAKLKARDEKTAETIREFRACRRIYRSHIEDYIANPDKFIKERRQKLDEHERMNIYSFGIKDNNENKKEENNEFKALRMHSRFDAINTREKVAKWQEVANKEVLDIFNELQDRGIINSHNIEKHNEEMRRALEKRNRESIALLEELKKRGIV